MKRSYQNADSQQGGGGNGAARKQKRGREERRFSPSDSGSHQDSDDDEYGHFSTQKEGQLIDNGRYEVMDELGKGTFGKVFRCRDLKHKDVVAIKVIRKISRYIDSAKIEASILNDVYEKQKHNKTKYCVKLFSHWKLDGTSSELFPWRYFSALFLSSPLPLFLSSSLLSLSI
jgi:serine/threonine protein kinase